ncbi:MAG: radical SAM protein [Desulfobacula sp.]|nr:radical SAM protein [Desulfobacula sp.]
MSGNTPVVLKKEQTVPMPHGSELMMLPQRRPVVYNIAKNQFEIIEDNPFDPGEKIFPVAVFNSPGYVNRHFCAYDDENIKNLLPLFSYGAVGFGKKNFRSAAILVDKEPRQDLRQMPHNGIVKGVKQMQEKYPDNRLIRHLETCALQYGCPAGKNFFLKRYEAPLPTSTVCNANCLGCISLQIQNNLCACQERISFTPSPEEIAQVSLEHISHVKKAVVSFGQGCEGDPLTAFKAIEPAIRLIRKKTDKGTINLNTNASLPHHVEKLCRAGLDSMRVSLNSVRENCYQAYFRPSSYQFSDVLKSIQKAKQQGKFVSINYLNCPGFTDSKKEFTALKEFIGIYKIDMIQWRNLNFDPKKYCELMLKIEDYGRPLGMETIIKQLSKYFPKLVHGYFNPPLF